VEYLTLQDPGPAPANATLRFQASDDSGNPVAVPPLSRALAASSRVTINVNDYLASAHVPIPVNLSVAISSDQPIVAERPMYFSADPGLGSTVNGGHDVVGAG
jgi:hypothetical protein